MTPGNDCAPAGCTVEARGDTKELAASLPHRTVEAQAGKALAILFFTVGARSLGETQAAFNRHPEWAPA